MAATAPSTRSSPSPSSRSGSSSAGASATSSTARSRSARAPTSGASTRGRRPRTASPGSHHVLSRVFKDIYPRYRTMRGYRVPRKAGWDCHGLPVELEVERELGISSKAEIEEYGIAEFNERCRESVFRYVEDWNRLTERIGFWIDLDDPYVTLDNDYIESVWWSLRKIWDDGRLYEGHKVVPYCPRCGTALSSHEVAQGYQDVEDPSVYVKLPVTRAPASDRRCEPGRPAARLDDHAVDADLQRRGRRRARRSSTCACDRQGADEVFVVAAPLVERVLGEGAEVLAALPGQRARRGPPTSRPSTTSPTTGRAATPCSRPTSSPPTRAPASSTPRSPSARTTSGSASSTGSRSRTRCAPDGTFDERITDFAGRFVKDADPEIVEALREQRPAAPRRALRARLPALLALRHAAPLLREVELVHPHHRRPRPHAGRERDDRLAPRAHQARPLRQVARGQRRLGALARALLGHAAADLGVRVRADCEERFCAGSIADLRERGGEVPDDLHRPYIDEVTLRCEACGGEMRRVQRDDRRLVRLGLDAVRAVPLPVRGRGGVRRALPGRLHLRGDRPDPRLVLLAARDLDAALRPHQLPQLRLPRA